ncbi:hypothetical protein [Pseudoduganella umbonata]|uniref:Uncharacterized protein n=1 Tax=Pseudoduganella umbonata TaxID=864828 RepID=A0A4P8HI07_9BURK|nr:hypothetical protein [Pseudoduganella umbonata]MBB3221626.1 hypothetical protein [Pseudoduganella umbonata]QCP09143.1 hypothetical protein FCL38_00835 [Pseudoduganella umbonata]
MDFEARIVGGEGSSITSAMACSLVGLGPVPGNGPASRLGERRQLVLDCRTAARGWSVAVRAIDAEGKVGAELARVDVQ